MTCYLCESSEPDKSNWFNEMCRPHKGDYIVKNRETREGAKKTCARKGHVWKHYLKEGEFLSIDGKEKCARCGRVIASFIRMSEAQNDKRMFNIGTSINSAYFLGRMEEQRKRLEKKHHIFEESTAATKVANTLYFLRYWKGWSTERIEKKFGMTSATLNKYLYMFPWFPTMDGQNGIKQENINGYPKEFYQVRVRILERDKYVCQACGSEKKRMTVHHRDENKHNNRLENLITLCPSCHMSHHKRRDKTKSAFLT